MPQNSNVFAAKHKSFPKIRQKIITRLQSCKFSLKSFSLALVGFGVIHRLDAMHHVGLYQLILNGRLRGLLIYYYGMTTIIKKSIKCFTRKRHMHTEFCLGRLQDVLIVKGSKFVQ